MLFASLFNGIFPIQFSVTVFRGNACEEFVESIFSFLLGFENEVSVTDLEGDFAVWGHGDGVGDRARDSEREIAGDVRCEGDAIG